LQTSARYRYNPKAYRHRARRAGFWHVNDLIAKLHATLTLRKRMATCPECDAEIEVDEFDVDKGDQLSCPDCGSNLEVTGLSPLELDLAPEDDDEDDDDEDEVEEDAADKDDDDDADADEDEDKDDEGWEE
jgi:alpha-aminoadipate carrier protein LysW